MRFNKQPYYKEYLLPASLAVIISFILLFLPPRSTTAKIGKVEQTQTTPLHINDKKILTENKTSQQTIVLMGDIMLSRSIGAWNKKGGYDRVFGSGIYSTVYNPISEITACKDNACLLFGNLESPFSSKDLDKHERTMRFKANTGGIAVLDTLRGTNIMVLTLANNHLNNAGGEGISTTTKILDENNFYHVGAGASKEEASKILTFAQNNINRCVAGYSYDGN